LLWADIEAAPLISKLLEAISEHILGCMKCGWNFKKRRQPLGHCELRIIRCNMLLREIYCFCETHRRNKAELVLSGDIHLQFVANTIIPTISIELRQRAWNLQGNDQSSIMNAAFSPF
jgi:hypothetical protein